MLKWQILGSKKRRCHVIVVQENQNNNEIEKTVELKGECAMPNVIMPREKWDPLYRKEKELRKKKALQWAKRHGCYEEVKRYYEMKEWLEKHVVY